MAIVAIDQGTSGTKALVIGDSGEVLSRGYGALDSIYKSPVVNATGQISGTSIYAIGNLVLPIKAADQCAVDAKIVARKVAVNLN